MNYTVTKKGQEIKFESSLSNTEAIEVIKDVKTDFHQSLAKNFDKNGSLSDKQWSWVHYLANEEKNKYIPVCSINFDKIWEALKKPTKLKNPSFLINNLKFSIPYNEDKKHLVAIINGNEFLGYINENFEFFGKKSILDVKDEIESINSDFIRSVKEHGLKHGSCCFCRKKLTTNDSLLNGYGETCAKNYRMPYEHSDVEETEIREVGQVVKYTGSSKKINGMEVKIVKINKKTYKILDKDGNEANVSKSTIFNL